MTILREEEHRALSSITLSGSVVDLGGDKRSAYHGIIGGERTVTTVNLDPKTLPDIEADLEKPLPLPDGAFDGVLLMNVLEHVYHVPQLLDECSRVLTNGGTAVIAVPYLFPYHASPHDYFRFSREALTRMLAEAGFSIQTCIPLGSGVFAVRFLMIERLLPGTLQLILLPVLHPLVRLIDSMFAGLARTFGKQYLREDYALGFVVTATTNHD